MKKQEISIDEFKAMFPGHYASEAQLQAEYQAFLQTIDQLEQMPTSELPDSVKTEVFRQAWYQRRPNWSWDTLAELWRRPAVTFAMGLAFGCLLMFIALGGSVKIAQTAQASPMLAVEITGPVQTYTGKTLEGLYPQIENPKLVVEKTDSNASPKRVLYGTLDDGNIHVVWNL